MLPDHLREFFRRGLGMFFLAENKILFLKYQNPEKSPKTL
jgi:hypothetical protein